MQLLWLGLPPTLLWPMRRSAVLTCRERSLAILPQRYRRVDGHLLKPDFQMHNFLWQMLLTFTQNLPAQGGAQHSEVAGLLSSRTTDCGFFPSLDLIVSVEGEEKMRNDKKGQEP